MSYSRPLSGQTDPRTVLACHFDKAICDFFPQVVIFVVILPYFKGKNGPTFLQIDSVSPPTHVQADRLINFLGLSFS